MRTQLLIMMAPLCGLVVAQDAGGDMLAGMSAMRRSDHMEAEQAFTRAVTNEPYNAKTWYYRGVNRSGKGDLQGALADLDQALKLEPEDVHSLLRRAEVRARMGAERLATNDLERILTIRSTGPATEHALLQLGHIALTRNDLVAAKGYYDRVIVIAPMNAFGWCDRGIVLAEMHQDDAAIRDFDRAVEIDPTLDQAYVHQAMAYFRLDRKQDGCFALRQAHDLGNRSVEEMLLIHCE